MLLSAVEDAPPISAVDVLAAELAAMVDARHVSLLIANFSGTAVNRLSHVTGSEAGHRGRDERLESLALPGSLYERVLFTQQIEVADQHGDCLVLVPVTERGDAIGILELSLNQRPDTETIDYLVDAAHALAYVLISSRRHTDLFVGTARHPLLCRGRNPTTSAPVRLHGRNRAADNCRLARARTRRRRRHLRLLH
jgi:hypothetical protein